MREIKFREWHQNHMRYWDDIGFFHLYVLNDGKGVFEQYTGINDVNGKEIYEGDIICQQMRFVETNGVIFWQEDKARFAVNLDGFITTITKPQEHSYEVIGNIHENAELLEVDE